MGISCGGRGLRGRLYLQSAHGDIGERRFDDWFLSHNILGVSAEGGAVLDCQ
jgi:hypothetical protein